MKSCLTQNPDLDVNLRYRSDDCACLLCPCHPHDANHLLRIYSGSDHYVRRHDCLLHDKQLGAGRTNLSLHPKRIHFSGHVLRIHHLRSVERGTRKSHHHGCVDLHQGLQCYCAQLSDLLRHAIRWVYCWGCYW